MKELFIAYSKYNQKINAIVFSYIEQLEYDQLGKNIDAYYKNIGENIFHVMNSDIKWLERLSGFRKFNITKEMLDIFMTDDKLDLSLVVEKKSDLIMMRSAIDQSIIELMETITEGEYLKEIEIQFGDGHITKPLWKLLFQWFNHHTHHRGQISLELELLGIDNDFSAVLDKID